MPLTVDIRDALDPNKLPVPPAMRILKIDVEDYTNWQGEPALLISVLLDESTDVEKIGGAAISKFEMAVHDNLQNQGIKLYPYFSFAKPSELAETDEDDHA